MAAFMIFAADLVPVIKIVKLLRIYFDFITNFDRCGYWILLRQMKDWEKRTHYECTFDQCASFCTKRLSCFLQQTWFLSTKLQFLLPNVEAMLAAASCKAMKSSSLLKAHVSQEILNWHSLRHSHSAEHWIKFFLALLASVSLGNKNGCKFQHYDYA